MWIWDARQHSTRCVRLLLQFRENLLVPRGLAEPPEEQFGKTMRIPDEQLAEWYRLVWQRDYDGGDPMQAKLMWFMPLAFSVMFFFFPAGLVLYWLTNTLLSIAQQWRINKLVAAEETKNKS